MPGGPLKPGAGRRLIAEHGRAAPGPIGGPRPIDRRGRPGIQPLEMAQRRVRLLLEAEREPAGQPLGRDELVARALAVLARELVGEIELAGPERAPDLQLALEPPARRPDQLARRVQKHRDHVVVAVLLPAPAQPVEVQAGIVAERGRHRVHRLVDRGLVPLQTDACHGELAIALGHAREHAVRGPAPVIPEQVVEPVDVVLGRQQPPVFVVEFLLLAGREIALDPGPADQVRGGLVLIDPEQRLGVADRAARGQRRPVLEELADQLVIGGIGDRALGDDLQLFRPGPVRVAEQEMGDAAEIVGLARLEHAHPAQRQRRHRVRYPLDQPKSAPEVAPVCGREGLADHRPVLRVERERRPDRGDQREAEGETEPDGPQRSPAQGRTRLKAAPTVVASDWHFPPSRPTLATRTHLGSSLARADDQPRHSTCRTPPLLLWCRSVKLPLKVRSASLEPQRPTERTGHVSRLHCGAHHALSQRFD